MTGLGAMSGLVGEAGGDGVAVRVARAGTNTSGAGPGRGSRARRAGAPCRSGAASPRSRPGPRAGCRRSRRRAAQLVAQARVEALDEAVLPRAARGDVGGPGTHGRDPSLDRLGDELRPVTGA